MSVPTAQFEALRVSSSMPAHTRSQSWISAQASAGVVERAIKIRDILSSFDSDILPCDYRPNIFQAITTSQRRDSDDPSHWVIQSDLQGSLFQLGTHDDTMFQALNKLQTESALARLFGEKLKRKFEIEFAAYDALPPTASDATPPAELRNLIDRLKHLVQAAEEDQSQRRGGETATARCLIAQIHELCTRHEIRLVKRRQPGRAVEESYLFHHLIGSASASTGFFALDMLEKCSTASRASLEDDLIGVHRALEGKGASAAYLAKLSSLIDSISPRDGKRM